MKKIALALTASLGLGLSGCATGPAGSWSNGITTNLDSFFIGVNQIAAVMNSPEGQQAIANLKAAYKGTVCGVASTSALIDQLAVASNAKKIINTVAIVMSGSASACKDAGGVVGS
jgi:hypothetical protein